MLMEPGIAVGEGIINTATGTVHLQLGLLQTGLTQKCCPFTSNPSAVMMFVMTWLPIRHLYQS